MEDLPGPRRAVDERDPLDGLVQPRRIHPRPNHLIARIQLQHRIGTIIDEPGG